MSSLLIIHILDTIVIILLSLVDSIVMNPWLYIYSLIVSSKSNFFLKIIISKCKISYDLVVSSARVFCIKRCILLTAHVSQFIVFEDSSFLIISILSIFFNWWMISSLQWSSLRCQNHDVVFVVVNFLDWTEFACLFSIKLNFSNRTLQCMFISHIFVSDFICIKMLICKSRFYLSLINRVNEMKVTSVDEIQIVFANFNLTILLFSLSLTIIVS